MRKMTGPHVSAMAVRVAFTCRAILCFRTIQYLFAGWGADSVSVPDAVGWETNAKRETGPSMADLAASIEFEIVDAGVVHGCICLV